MTHRSFLSASLLTTLLLAAVPGLNADSIPTFYATAVNADLGSSPDVTATISGLGFSLTIDDYRGFYPVIPYLPGAPLGSPLAGALYASLDPQQYPPDIGRATIDLPGGPFYAELSGEVDVLIPPNSVLPYLPPTGGIGIIPAVAEGSFYAFLPFLDPNLPAIAKIVVDLPGEYEVGAVPSPNGFNFLVITGQGFTAPTPEPSTALLFLAGGALAASVRRRRQHLQNL